MRRFSEWMIKKRLLVLAFIITITLIFSLMMVRLRVETRFDDLLPRQHPYISVHKEYEKLLGTPYKVQVVLQVTNGDIYNPETLKKAVQITDALDLIPGVDHEQIFSIASRKIKKVSITAYGVITENFMDKVPKTPEELDVFRETVRKTGSVYRVWVSPDEKSLFFTASFIPELVNPSTVLQKALEIKSTFSDSNHKVFVAGEPILNGLVYSYQKETFLIFGFTFLTLIVLLALYFRNIVGVIIPTLCTLIGGVWGIGFGGILGDNLEPLTLVLPLLLAARNLAHSVQLTERYFEWYAQLKDAKKAAVECCNSMLAPGALGIITDGLGIILIACAPIPMMQKMAYICGFWAFAIILNTIMLTPILLSFFKPPRNVEQITHPERSFVAKLLAPVSKLTFGSAGIGTFVVTATLLIVCGWNAMQVNIGDIHPGSPILWPDSDYNLAINEINKNFPGTEELYILFEGGAKNAVEEPSFLNILDSFQRHMEKDPRVATTLSVQDFLPPIQASVYAGYFKWQVLPVDARNATQLLYLLTSKAGPADYDLYFSRDRRTANVIVWYKDHMGDTIRSAISRVKEFTESTQGLLKEKQVSVKLASGNLGVLAAVNETVKTSQVMIVTLVSLLTFVFCSIIYRSFMAAIVLMIPLNLANVLTLCFMKAFEIGLNINALPIISVGVGIGIDYGIYLLSRITEETRLTGAYSLPVVTRAIRSTGKAIFFTALSMIAGVVFWYFFSSLKFQAEMGLMLGVIMFLNMLGALVVLPCMLYVFRPGFLKKKVYF